MFAECGSAGVSRQASLWQGGPRRRAKGEDPSTVHIKLLGVKTGRGGVTCAIEVCHGDEHDGGEGSGHRQVWQGEGE